MKNSEQVGITAAMLMDKLDEDYDDKTEIAETIIICRIQGKMDDNDDVEWSAIQWRASDPVWSHQLGLIEGCLEGMRNSRADTMRGESGEDDDDPDTD